MADAALLAEAYKRGILPADKAAAYEEGVRRGLVQDEFAAGKLTATGSKTGAAAGWAATVGDALVVGDELQAGLDAAQRVVKGEKPSEAWKGARERQQGLMTGYRQDHRLGSDLATGIGYAAQAAPAILSGGTTVAPQLSAGVGKSIAQRAGGMLMSGARNATVGATYGAANAAGSRGSMTERVQAADDAIAPGAVVGLVAPGVLGAASKAVSMTGKVAAATARTGVRAANAVAAKTPAGAFLNPQTEVLDRLAQALKGDGLGEQQIRSVLTEWERVGSPTPAFMDLVAKNGGGQKTMALIRGAAMSGEGRNVASQYSNRVAADVQDHAIDRTRQLTTDARSLPEIGADVDRRVATHSAVPAIEAGSGGAQVHGALNARFDQAKSAVDQAFSAARAAQPEAAHLTASEFPQMAANVREAVRDYHPDTIPGVTRILGDMDSLSTPTVRDLFDARQQLSSLRGSADPVQGGAAARASRALDAEIQNAVDRGAVSGDPTVVGLWRDAIGLRRDMGRQFEGDDLIAQLTERTMHGGGRTNAVAAEDASNAVLGRNGVSQRPDLVRDLTRLRDTLGADSPEWNSLRVEAQHRLLGRDAGTENFGQAWEQFSTQSPQLARILMSPQEQAALTGARRGVSDAVADRGAVEAGQRVLSAPSDEYAASMTSVGGRRLLAQVGAARELQGMIERPTQGATGALNRVSSSTRARNNLSETFGESPAADYQASIGNTVEQVQNARQINPNTGSQTAVRQADEALVESIPLSKMGLVAKILERFKAGATLTDTERGELVRLATSPAGDVTTRIMDRVRPSVSMVTRVPVGPAIAGPMSQENRR